MQQVNPNATVRVQSASRLQWPVVRVPRISHLQAFQVVQASPNYEGVLSKSPAQRHQAGKRVHERSASRELHQEEVCTFALLCSKLQ